MEGRRERLVRNLRSMQSAAIAGLVFSVCSTIALLRLFGAPGLSATDAEIEAWWSADDAGDGLVLTVQLVFFGVVGFLWFIGVIRARMHFEPKLFSTVFFGGGVVLVGLLLVGTAALAVPAIFVRFADRVPSVDVVLASRALGAALIIDLATRVQALVIFSTSGLARQTGALPRWLVVVGFAVGLFLLFNVSFRTPTVFVAFQAWVALVSVVVLVSRSGRSPAADGGTSDAQ